MVNKMKIEKEYNVQELANKVKEEIEKCRKCGTKRIGIDIITAQEIVDVLEVVASWENKRAELNDISDEESKGCCFGWHINGDKKCNLCVYERECMIEAKKERSVLENLMVKDLSLYVGLVNTERSARN
jgi:hypothetical protein